MVLLADTDNRRTLEEVAAFVAGHAAADIARPSRAAAYLHIGPVLARFAYWKQGRKAQGLLRRYPLLVPGLSESQLTRLVARYLAEGVVEDRRRGFRRTYPPEDIALLAETDGLHGTLSGPATRQILERAFKVFGDPRYERLAGLSSGHLYNLRRHSSYERLTGAKTRTRDPGLPCRQRVGVRELPGGGAAGEAAGGANQVFNVA